MSYVIVKDGTETTGEYSRRARFYFCLPDVPRAVWSWTCQQEVAFRFESREEAQHVARTKIRTKKGVRVVEFRKRSCGPRCQIAKGA
jgi:hypothetical protein